MYKFLKRIWGIKTLQIKVQIVYECVPFEIIAYKVCFIRLLRIIYVYGAHVRSRRCQNKISCRVFLIIYFGREKPFLVPINGQN